MKKFISSAFLLCFSLTLFAQSPVLEILSDAKKDSPVKTDGTKAVAVLAGGCFWGVEDLLRKLPGVLNTDVGYAGGSSYTAKYSSVKTGTTEHAEAVRVVYDPTKVSYKEILKYFFRLHDPTTLNRQGNDVGPQYRSAIFYIGEKQKEVAEKVIQEVDKSKKWKKPVVTKVVPFKGFYLAEDYHQDYLVKNPNGYTCHFLRE